MMALAALGYLLSCLAFGLLTAWPMIAWRGRPHAKALSACALASAFYSAAVVAAITINAGWPLLLDSLELLRSTAWSLLLLSIIRSCPKNPAYRRLAIAPALFIVIALCAVLVLMSLLHAASDSLGARQALGLRATVYILVAVVGMALIEHLYRNTPHDDRWAVKFMCLGIGAVFAYTLYLYSNAMLFGALNADLWAARGFVDLLAVPLIVVSFSRNPKWMSGLSVSRRILFHSTAVIGAASYLLMMASAGYAIRVSGRDWGPVLELAFLAGALILLIAVLSSGTARAWLRVFIAKHFYRYSYDYREEWLQFTRTLSQDGPALPERVVKALAALVESPGGWLWVRDERSFRQEAAWNVPAIHAREPVNSPLCDLMQQRQWIIDLDVPDRVPGGEPRLVLPAWLDGMPTARTIVPLNMRGHLIGFVILTRPRSKLLLDWEVFDLLRVAASQAASYLAEQRAMEALMVARQFESFSRMSTFVVHDLKNLVSQLSLAVSNIEHHCDDPAFQAELQGTLTHSVDKMRLLMQRLRPDHVAERSCPVALDTLIRQVVAEKAALRPPPAVQRAQEGLIVLANPTLLARIIGHLLQNAIEATARTGQVWINVSRHGDCAEIEVGDTGHGMSPEFVCEKLFKPFNTTKPAGMGIGVFETRTYVEQLGGTLEVDSRPFQGTVFTLVLPLYRYEGVTIENATA